MSGALEHLRRVFIDLRNAWLGIGMLSSGREELEKPGDRFLNSGSTGLEETGYLPREVDKFLGNLPGEEPGDIGGLHDTKK